MADDLALILSEVQQLRAEVRALPDAIAAAIVASDRRRVPHGPNREALVRLGCEIEAATVGELPFSVAELIRHAALPQSLALRSAIDDVARGTDPSIAVGRALARIEQNLIGDVSVERLRKERGVWIWSAKKR